MYIMNLNRTSDELIVKTLKITMWDFISGWFLLKLEELEPCISTGK